MKILRSRKAGKNHRVITVTGRTERYRKKPCRQCPWRRDAPVGAFPAEAFRISAPTSYDMSDRVFGCHMAGKDKASTCAGFLLRAEHNLEVRMAASKGLVDLSKVSAGGIELYDDYREMAIANGVDPDDPVLRRCR